MFKYIVLVAALLAVAFAAAKPGLAYTSGVVSPAVGVAYSSVPAVASYSAYSSPVVSAYGAHPVAYTAGAYGAYGYGAPLAYY